MQQKKKLIRITTVPNALAYPLRGQSSYMHTHGFDVLMVSSDGKDLKVALEQEICPHHIIHMTRKITPFQDLVSLWALIRFFSRHKPDIVHSETPKAGLLGMIAARLCGVKLRIHTVAGLPLMVEKGMKLKLLEWIEKITYGAATNVWPNSNSLKEFILQHKFCKEKKLDVVGKGSSNGLDLQKFDPQGLDPFITDEIKADIDYDPGNCYWLNVGRLVLDKGIVELVEAFLELKTTNPRLKLLLVGQYEVDLDPVPAHISEEIAGNKDIIHLPWTERVEYFMALSHYYVFPTYREGFPNVLLEAAAMNLPIICSEVAGNIDIVQHEKTGFLFEVASTAALVAAMKKAMENEQQMQVMAETLRHFITSNYGREQFWQEMLQDYNRLLENKNLS